MRRTWSVVGVGTVALASAGAAIAWTSPETAGGRAPDGRVVDADGDAVAGAMVTATLPDGRTMTVYTRPDGSWSLPDEADGATSLAAWAPGVGAADGVVAADAGLLRLEDPDGRPAPGSAWLASLPDGEDRRRFILDCTGCHVTNGGSAGVPGGVVRDEASWAVAIQRMVTNFGPGTGFPIISSWVEPTALAGWLHDGLGATPTAETPALTGPAGSAAVLTEYPVPAPQDLPHDVAVAPSGDVLVTGMFTHRMYVLDPATGTFSTTPIPVPGANPRAVDVDADGRWWVVLGGPGALAVHDPATGEWETHQVGMYGHSVALDAEGDAWVNGHFTVDPEVVASVDGGTGEIRRYEIPHEDGVPAESTIPYGLRAAPDGSIWGTQLRGNRLVRLDPASGTVDQWTLPISHSGPRRPDPAPDGSIWVPLYSANALARFDPASETFETWPFPVEGALPYIARVDARTGLVWLGTGHGDVVASFDPARESFTLYPLPTRGALVRHLDVDEERGEVWFAYGASPGVPGKILRLRPGG